MRYSTLTRLFFAGCALTLLLLGACSESEPEELNLDTILVQSDEAMNSLDSYRFDYEEVSLSDEHVLGRHRGLAVLPDATCEVSLSNGRVSRESIRIGRELWNRSGSRPWERSEATFSPGAAKFQNAQGSGYLAAYPELEDPEEVIPTDVTLAGEEVIGDRETWVIGYQYVVLGIEGFDEFVKLWVDQQTYHVLKMELTNNDRYASNSVRRWVYRDFNDGAIIIEPLSGFTQDDSTPTPTC